MMFKNREHAATLLARKFAKYKVQKPLVLGIPRGALPMAKIIADGVEGDTEVPSDTPQPESTEADGPDSHGNGF